MRTLTHAIVGGVTVLSLTCPAWAEDFEGIVRFKSTHDGKAREYDYLMKGNKTRIEIGGEPNRSFNIVVDRDNKKTLMLMPERKMVMEMPMMDEPQGESSALGKKEVNFIRTGKTDTVLGRTCELILVKMEEGESEICGAKGMGYYAGMHRPGRGADGAPAWAKDLAEGGFFPLRVITKGNDGAEKMRLEATKIEQKTLDAALFTTPPDYKKFDRGGMPGMGGPGGMREGMGR